jgi:hypothetical protein
LSCETELETIIATPMCLFLPCCDGWAGADGGLPLSELEKRMMYFTENEEMLEDPIALNEVGCEENSKPHPSSGAKGSGTQFLPNLFATRRG